jgi:hypothetical protein
VLPKDRAHDRSRPRRFRRRLELERRHPKLQAGGYEVIAVANPLPAVGSPARIRIWMPIARATRPRRRAADTYPFILDLHGPDQFRELVPRLQARRHSASKMEKLLGRDFLRLMGEVWS